eukprot:11487210-Heterocapsa_arctica.AAC.1
MSSAPSGVALRARRSRPRKPYSTTSSLRMTPLYSRDITRGVSRLQTSPAVTLTCTGASRSL